MKKRMMLSFLVLMLAFSVVLAGCGGAADTDEPQGSEEPQESESPQDAVPEESSFLIEDGVFTFAMSGEYHPFNYSDEATGELTGFDVEIGTAIAEYHGWEANPVATPWSGILSGLRSGNFDAIIGSMGITAEREEQVDFSKPYYLSGAQLFVRPGSTIQSIEDITDEHAIGVALGTTYEEEARDYTSNVSTYESDVTALRDLATSENLDAVITDRLVGLINIEETGFELEMAGELIFEEYMGIPVQKGNQELLDLINEALDAIRADGTYLEISERYFGADIGRD